MWQRIETPEQVRPRAGIGGHRCFRLHVFVGLARDITLTPVAFVNASTSFTKASSSDWTKYFHRSIESLASFSGFQGAFCAQTFAHSSKAEPVKAPAATAAVPPLTRVRRVKLLMVVPPLWF